MNLVAPVFSVFGIVTVLFGCAQSPVSEDIADILPKHSQIVREIEAAVVLPSEADPIENYARHYAMDHEGNVVAVYLIPSATSSVEQGCEVALKNFGSRPCDAQEIAEGRKHLEEIQSRDGIAGQVIWHDSEEGFPFVLDGGCSFISITYQPKTKSFETLVCNGLA
ncbi:hypothetical protein EH31_02640 [Erythrobacter longus]|uniref:Uncharacterized protein n=1 Tax=Erythrobacter longus TaxID=1044 RepID=A0A074M9V3_ERYLO|nr:hypothetical protein [Erythrobacter longus]KEO91586.1 hypothetical protein EH31_02640 [Erythrobacter longus]